MQFARIFAFLIRSWVRIEMRHEEASQHHNSKQKPRIYGAASAFAPNSSPVLAFRFFSICFLEKPLFYCGWCNPWQMADSSLHSEWQHATAANQTDQA
jgi:hypothetical protein